MLEYLLHMGRVQKIFDVEGRSQKPGELTDGQIYFTTKAFRHFWFGLGNWNSNIEALMKKIEKIMSIYIHIKAFNTTIILFKLKRII